ncbi:hypothetical protein Q763_10015 [Flavobacterium beibuense F44-8]|uniref:Uncharacterized protein n=1 Tax=Flavobacterium beibuense F44-8 TaxID=1406840 RepID=A0A0A2LNF0_9FLAO|nr:flagellar FlbD family protein [Flavobacterium beibuense]KGO80856.1 hypothetical protein Q763_10015 [Flavobacterium beibuense F44-8]
MKKFIEVTYDGKRMVINIDHIVNYVEQKSKGVYITLIDGSSRTIKESYEEITNLIEGVEKSIYSDPDVEFKC